jgi:hypothetical protein
MGAEGIHFALFTGVEALLRALAAGVEWAHGLAMLIWALGLPLLLWHGWPRLSRIAMWFSVVFVVVSVGSHQLLGHCVLTALAGYLWQAAGGYDEGVPFVVSLTQRIAGVRPSARAAVLAWELAIAAYSVAILWCWRGLPGKRRRARAEPQGWPGR